MKYVFLIFAVLFIFAGCSAKEINANVDSITNDVSTAFEDSKNK